MPNFVSTVEKGSNKTLICIAGPTAVGKTSMAIEIAEALNCEILSFDSRQFYRELKIGTAPPSAAELKRVKHHFILDRSIKEELNAASYAQEALSLMEQLFQRQDYLVLVGGSGLYLKALIEGFDELPEIDPKFRAELNLELELNGISPLQKELEEKDPEYYRHVDLNNPQRLIRALEIIRATQKKFSSFRNQKKRHLPYRVLQFALYEEREILYQCINQRVDLMLEEGLEKEAKSLIAEQERSSLQTVGYKEFFAYFRGEYSREHCIEEIKKNSRRYAKRQLTWFRKNDAMLWYHRKDKMGILKAIKGE